ncbi:MAG: hypothetical protein SFV21_09430 [Rhodospirillaceae bacterium]|nr:hypothetical protein [Rhodospirillaceae bacterium]
MAAKSPKTPPTPAPPRDAARALESVDDRRARNRVMQLRERLGKAVDDPVVAARMARYLQELMREGR